MANLLPKEALRSVRKLHKARFVFVGSLVASTCGVFALLTLIPTYILVSIEHPMTSTTSDGEIALPASTDRDDLVRAQIMAKELQPFASSTASALPILAAILDVRPAGTIITSIRFARGNPHSIIINGEAPSRDEINEYRAILTRDARYENVSVPIGVLAGSEDGRFSITITGSF